MTHLKEPQPVSDSAAVASPWSPLAEPIFDYPPDRRARAWIRIHTTWVKQRSFDICLRDSIKEGMK